MQLEIVFGEIILWPSLISVMNYFKQGSVPIPELF